MAWIEIWSAPIFGKFLDPPLGKMDFRFNYAPDCTLSSMNFLTEPPPHSISDFVLESGFALNSPSNYFPQQKGTRLNTVCPSLNALAKPRLIRAQFWRIHGSATENLKDRFSLQLYTRSHGFKYEFSKTCWGGAHRAPSPNPSPTKSRALPSIRASPSILGRFALSVRASPSIFDRLQTVTLSFRQQGWKLANERFLSRLHRHGIVFRWNWNRWPTQRDLRENWKLSCSRNIYNRNF